MKAILLFLFFLSGCSALIYQIVWSKLLGLVVGNDLQGISTVLVAVMAGLAVGGRIGGRWTDRFRNPRALYGGIECGIGLLGLVSPWAFQAIEQIYPLFYQATEQAPVLRLLLRTLISLVALMPPCLLMGATFPAMGKLLAAEGRVGRDVALFYAWNTLGAAVGAISAAWLWIPRFGLDGSLYLAAGGNFLVGVCALRLRALRWEETKSSGPPAEAPPRFLAGLLLAVFLSGFASLAYEVVLARNLVMNFGASAYAFSIVLAVFLLGIGLGALLYPARWEEPRRALRAFLSLQLLAACGALLGPILLERFFGMENLLRGRQSYFPGATTVPLLWIWQILASAGALLPFALALGFSFPAALRAATTSRQLLGTGCGRVYWWSTWGAALGAGLAHYVLIPSLGSPLAIVAVAALHLAAAWVVVFWAKEFASRWTFGAVNATALLLAGFWIFGADRGPAPLWHREGSHATVSVEEVEESDGTRNRVFRINGRVEASTAVLDMRLQRLLGHLPIVLHPRPERALVVGLGSGVTAGSSAAHRRVARVDVVELNPEVVEAARMFAAQNHLDAFPEGKLRLFLEDARNFFLGSEERYDVITTDPIHPWTAGSGHLYTVEYFRRMREHLAADGSGIAGQWVPLYQLSLRDIGSIIASFRQVFPRVQLWLTSVDLVLIGSERPLRISETECRERMADLLPVAAGDWEEIGIRSAADLLCLYLGGNDLADRLASGSPRNHDLKPWLEYSAPYSILVPFQAEFYEKVMESYPPADLPYDFDPQGEGKLGQSQRRLQRAVEAFLRPLRSDPPDPGGASLAFLEALRE